MTYEATQTQPEKAEQKTEVTTSTRNHFFLSVRLLLSSFILWAADRLHNEDSLNRAAGTSSEDLMRANLLYETIINRLHEAVEARQALEYGVYAGLPLSCVRFDDTIDRLLAETSIGTLDELLELNPQELVIEEGLPLHVVSSIQSTLLEVGLHLKPLPMK